MQQALYLAHEMKFMIIQPSIGINPEPMLESDDIVPAI
jgi:hypothetical protein